MIQMNLIPSIIIMLGLSIINDIVFDQINSTYLIHQRERQVLMKAQMIVYA